MKTLRIIIGGLTATALMGVGFVNGWGWLAGLGMLGMGGAMVATLMAGQEEPPPPIARPALAMPRNAGVDATESILVLGVVAGGVVLAAGLTYGWGWVTALGMLGVGAAILATLALKPGAKAA